ncbi:MAG TPA: flavin reductase family protein [Pirellulales bacterium]|jgi:flavin reductase (DIM6/NTAB) family NADH-FMN oxidoreductase RutF
MSGLSFAGALGQIPSGLFILSVRQAEMETGMLASWVVQAGFEPPMLTVAVKLGRYVADWLTAGAPFVLNIIGEEHKSLISRFGKGFEPGELAFEGLNIERTVDQTPILADALGWLECRPMKHFDSGDHRIFLTEITAGELAGSGKPYVHIRKNGLRY